MMSGYTRDVINFSIEYNIKRCAELNNAFTSDQINFVLKYKKAAC